MLELRVAIATGNEKLDCHRAALDDGRRVRNGYASGVLTSVSNRDTERDWLRMTWHQTVAVGNLGGDPDLKFMQSSGDAVCNFSVAVSEKWNDKRSGEQKESTTWYRVAVWGAQAEACNKYLRKGSKVLVTGTVSARAYTGNGGDAVASLDLRAFNVRFLDSAGERPAAGRPAGEYQAPQSVTDVGEIPF